MIWNSDVTAEIPERHRKSNRITQIPNPSLTLQSYRTRSAPGSGAQGIEASRQSSLRKGEAGSPSKL